MNNKVKRLDVISKKKRLYLQYLQENQYLVQFEKKVICNFLDKKNNISIKRHVYDMRFYGLYKTTQSNDLKKINSVCENIMDSNDRSLFEQLILVLSLEYNRTISITNKYEILLKKNIFSSFHSVFVSIEDKLQSHAAILASNISFYLHPELFIRILGVQIQDVAFIDLLRRKFHIIAFKLFYPSIYIKDVLKKYIMKIIWNLWIFEFESFIQHEFLTLLYHFKSNYDNKLSFLRKKKYFYLSFVKKKLEFKKKYHQKSLENNFDFQKIKKFFVKSSNYLQYTNNWIIGLDAKLIIVNLLKYRCKNFWKHRIGVLIKDSKFKVIHFQQNNCLFLGSLFQQKSNNIDIQVILTNKFILPINFVTNRSISVSIPLLHLIKILSKYGLCKINGYPISKSSWSTWPDEKIIEKFSQILISINSYYSGCINKKKISHIEYILSYSCAKTLACKHKTTLRSIWYTYAEKFASNYLLFKNINFLKGKHIALRKKKLTKYISIWNLHHINDDNIIYLLIE